jgi:hypothetical protein
MSSLKTLLVYNLLTINKLNMIILKPKEPVLTEFQVTETYTVKAVTLDQAAEMVSSNEFPNGIDKHNVQIKPNF